MSAYVVDKTHLDALIALAHDGPRGVSVSPDHAWYGFYWSSDTPDGTLTHRSNQYAADAIGRMLAAECVASVNYRYPDDTVETLPGPIDRYYNRPYTYARPAVTPTAVEGLKLIDCYEYQSCEHPGWRASEAYDFCRGLRGALIGRLDGYDAAPWGWPE